MTHQSGREYVCVCVCVCVYKEGFFFYKHLRIIQQIELRKARLGGHQTEKLSQASEVQIVWGSQPKRGRALTQRTARRIDLFKQGDELQNQSGKPPPPLSLKTRDQRKRWLLGDEK